MFARLLAEKRVDTRCDASGSGAAGQGFDDGVLQIDRRIADGGEAEDGLARPQRRAASRLRAGGTD